MLFAECTKSNVTIRNPVSVESMTQEGDLWLVQTNRGLEKIRSVVMATGGLPMPAIGATAYSLDIAKQFGLQVVDPRPALVPLSFTADTFEISMSLPA